MEALDRLTKGKKDMENEIELKKKEWEEKIKADEKENSEKIAKLKDEWITIFHNWGFLLYQVLKNILKITNNNHDINQLDESFNTAKVKLISHFGKLTQQQHITYNI